MIVYVKNPKDSTKKATRTSKYVQTVGNVNLKNPDFQYHKNMKYLGIYLTNVVTPIQ